MRKVCIGLLLCLMWQGQGIADPTERPWEIVTVKTTSFSIPRASYFDTLVREYCPPPTYERTYPACKDWVDTLELQSKALRESIGRLRAQVQQELNVDHEIKKASDEGADLMNGIDEFRERQMEGLYWKVHH